MIIGGLSIAVLHFACSLYCLPAASFVQACTVADCNDRGNTTDTDRSDGCVCYCEANWGGPDCTMYSPPVRTGVVLLTPARMIGFVESCACYKLSCTWLIYN